MAAKSRFSGVSAFCEAVEQQVEGVHQRIPSRMPGGQRYVEADVEEVPAAHRQHGAHDQVAQQGAAAQRPGAAGEEQRTGDRPAEEVHEQQVEHQDADQLADGDPVGRAT